MRVLLAPVGSRGDVQPLLALGLGLRRRGHEVEFLTAVTFESLLARKHGFVCHPGIADIQTKLQENATALASPMATARLLIRESKTQLQTALDLLSDLVPRFDLVIGAGVQLAAASVCEAAGVPYRYVLYVPQLLPSGAHPPFLLPRHGLPAWLNRLSHQVSDRLVQRFMLRPVTSFRRRHQLPDPRNLSAKILGERPILCCSPSLAVVPPDTPLAAVQTGALTLAAAADGALSTKVRAFLRAGPAPFYVGFGSMVDPNPGATAALIAAAAAEAEVRVILCTGWSEADAIEGDDLLVITSAPHGLLLPRCAGAVHHGGAGTVQAVAQAGIPQLLVPHLMDQFYWAQRIAALAVGPNAIARPRLSADSLATALRSLRDDTEQRRRARDLGTRIAQESGLLDTINLLESEV